MTNEIAISISLSPFSILKRYLMRDISKGVRINVYFYKFFFLNIRWLLIFFSFLIFFYAFFQALLLSKTVCFFFCLLHLFAFFLVFNFWWCCRRVFDIPDILRVYIFFISLFPCLFLWLNFLYFRLKVSETFFFLFLWYLLKVFIFHSFISLYLFNFFLLFQILEFFFNSL